MATIVPYINFADKGREMLEFYQAAFGGDYTIQLVKESPMASQMNPEWGERIMHADFQSGDIHFLGSDIISDDAGLERGNGYSLTVECDSEDQLRGYYEKFVDGGQEMWAPALSEWGDIFGQCVDKYGVQWMFNCHVPASEDDKEEE